MRHFITAVFVVWIAYWTAEWYEPSLCQETHQVDPYTGSALLSKPWPSGTSIRAGGFDPCVTKQQRALIKSFDTKAEAELFIKGCREPKCTGWRLEEVHL